MLCAPSSAYFEDSASKMYSSAVDAVIDIGTWSKATSLPHVRQKHHFGASVSPSKFVWPKLGGFGRQLAAGSFPPRKTLLDWPKP